MLQIIHSDEEWCDVIRRILIAHQYAMIEVLICSSVEEWKKHISEPIIFIEQRFITQFDNYDGKIIALVDDGEDSETSLLAYKNPVEVVEQMISYRQMNEKDNSIAFQSRLDKTKMMVVAYVNTEIAQKFAECYSEKISFMSRKTAILNLQIPPYYKAQSQAIPITKLILQLNDPIEQIILPSHTDSDYVTLYNSFHVEEFIETSQSEINEIIEKLLAQFQTIICIVDGANVHLQNKLSSIIDSTICISPKSENHNSGNPYLHFLDSVTKYRHMPILSFEYAESWRKSLQSEVEKWIISNQLR